MRRSVVNQRIPSEDDWGDWQKDIDASFAHEIYFGRSNEQMQDHFVAAPIEAASELQFMSGAAFQYYVLGFMDSVLSGRHDEMEAANAASSFLRLIHEKAKTSPRDILPIIDVLMPSLERIADEQSSFSADPEIFGDFREIVRDVRLRLAGRE